MDSAKYIGLDVHKESISIAVLNAAGKIVMECVIETNATLITYGQSVPVNITVSAATGTPTGDVVLVGGQNRGRDITRFTLINGSVNSSTSTLPRGSYFAA